MITFELTYRPSYETLSTPCTRNSKLYPYSVYFISQGINPSFSSSFVYFSSKTSIKTSKYHNKITVCLLLLVLKQRRELLFFLYLFLFWPCFYDYFLCFGWVFFFSLNLFASCFFLCLFLFFLEFFLSFFAIVNFRL